MQTNSKKSATRSSPVKGHDDGGTPFDGVLRRMLSTPPAPNKDKAKKPQKKKVVK